MAEITTLDSGEVQYYVDGKLHQDAGPAVIKPDGSVEYWVNGEKLSEDEYKKFFLGKITQPGYELTDDDRSFLKDRLIHIINKSS